MLIRKTLRRLTKSFFNLKFKYQLLSTYLALSLIPVLVLGIFSFNQSNSLLSSSKEKDINYYFEKASYTLDEVFKNSENIINDIANNAQFKKIFYADYETPEMLQNDIRVYLEPYLYNLKIFNPFIREITFYSKLGITPYRSVIHDYDELIVNTNSKSNMTWYYNGKFIVLKYDLMNNKEAVGSICLYMWPKVLMKSVNTEFMNYNILLTTEDTDYIYTHTVSFDKEKPDTEQLITLKNNTLKLNSKEYLTLGTSLDNGYRLYAYILKDEVVAGSGAILRSTWIAILVCLVFIVIIDFIFSLSFTKRIHLLTKKIEYAKKGNLKIPLHSENRDEIGTLTNDIGDMIKKIDNLIQTVYESEITQKKAELKALQAQINPHFLYNTLQTVNWIAIDNDAPEISELVVNLSDFYRATLNKNKETVTVGDELKMVECYFGIEKIVLGDSFDVEFDIEEGISDYQTIHLILQPLAENAIEHGMRKLRDKRGYIRISVKRDGDTLVFNVSDNGLGITTNALDDLAAVESKRGFGLKNVDDRIKLRYGNKYGITITSAKNPTTFTIKTPIIRSENSEN